MNKKLLKELRYNAYEMESYQDDIDNTLENYLNDHDDYLSTYDIVCDVWSDNTSREVNGGRVISNCSFDNDSFIDMLRQTSKQISKVIKNNDSEKLRKIQKDINDIISSYDYNIQLLNDQSYIDLNGIDDFHSISGGKKSSCEDSLLTSMDYLDLADAHLACDASYISDIGCNLAMYINDLLND